MTPNLDAMQMMNMGMYYGTNGIDAQSAINMVGTAVGGQTYGEIAWFSNAIQTMSNGTAEQKAQTATNFVTKALSWFTSGMGVKEGQNAGTETAQHKAQAQQVIDNQKQEMDRINSEINTINTEIEARLDAINEAIQHLEETGEELTAQQQEAKEKQEEITRKQEELQSATDDKQKVAILKEIQGLTGELKAIVETMTAAEDVIDESNEIVENNNGQIEDLSGQAGEVITAGNETVSNGVSEGMAALANGQSDLKTGTEDTTAAIKLEAKAAATTGATFGIGAGAASQMLADAAGFHTGSAARFSGGAAVLSLASTGIGNWNNTLPILTNFENSIGQYTSLSSGYVGAFTPSYENFIGMITTIGSQTTSIDTLNTAVENDITTLENQPEVEGEEKSPELQSENVEIEEIEA